ncbi:MAG: esterase/lipase family protein [Tepidisphaeraceae bacterium]
MIDALHASGIDTPFQIVTWGAPPALFFLNFQTRSIHAQAERQLRDRILAWRSEHPRGRVDLIGHSAGCGVILGALSGAPAEAQVKTVILLAPSVSPSYDLAPALARVSGTICVFHSDSDWLHLAWRTSTFGTYDNVKTRAAGNVAFDLSQLPVSQSTRVVQLQHDAGHFGCVTDRNVTFEVASVLTLDERSGLSIEANRK